MIDTSLHNVNNGTLEDEYSPKLETTRAISPLRARKNHLAANYAVTGEQRVALRQKRNSWGSMDILDLLDVDDFADDEEGEGPSVVGELAGDDSSEQGRRNGMGEKQVHDMLVSAAQKNKIIASGRPRRTFSGKKVSPLNQAKQRPSLMRQPQHLSRQPALS